MGGIVSKSDQETMLEPHSKIPLNEIHKYLIVVQNSDSGEVVVLLREKNDIVNRLSGSSGFTELQIAKDQQKEYFQNIKINIDIPRDR